jgi:hypothetical protein
MKIPVQKIEAGDSRYLYERFPHAGKTELLKVLSLQFSSAEKDPSN